MQIQELYIKLKKKNRSGSSNFLTAFNIQSKQVEILEYKCCTGSLAGFGDKPSCIPEMSTLSSISASVVPF